MKTVFSRTARSSKLFADTSRLSTKANPPQAAEDVSLSQGYLELSNVNAVQTMTQLIETTRIFETYQKVINAMDQADGKAVNDLGKLTP